MPNNTLGQIAFQEIRAAMSGLKGSQAKEMALKLAKHFNVSWQYIYAITADLRPKRKPRSDKGKRSFSLDDPGMELIGRLAALGNVNPELAIKTAKLNGHQVPSLGTTRRILRESGLNRSANNANARPHRNFESAYPGQLFEFDMSTVKKRWVDRKTLGSMQVTSLEVSKNHDNKKPDRVKLWKFALVDCYSRKKYIDFYACLHPTSVEVIDFLLGAFREMGIPETLYTDNDATIVGKRMRRAEGILNKAFESTGGFKLETHLPGNAQATGKVENTHLFFEEFEKLIAIKRIPPSLENLKSFARWTMNEMNERIHRKTGEAPNFRWQSKLTTLRVPPDNVFDAAFKCEEFERQLRRDMTFSINSVSYQVPRKRPFVDWIDQKITIIWPAGDAEYYVLIGLDGVDYEIERKVATADAAGEFKTPEQSTRQRNIKKLEASAAAHKQEMKATGTDLLVPGFDSVAAIDTKRIDFPKPKLEMDPDLLASLSHHSISTGRNIAYFDAVDLLIKEEVFAYPVTEIEKTWLKSVFANRERIDEQEIRTALETRNSSHSILKLERRA
jgi:hypothetical protein